MKNQFTIEGAPYPSMLEAMKALRVFEVCNAGEGFELVECCDGDFSALITPDQLLALVSEMLALLPVVAGESGWRQVAALQLKTIVLRDQTITELQGRLSAIWGAANCDLKENSDIETAVRKLYHDNEDLKQENSKLRRAVMKESHNPFAGDNNA